VRSDRIGNALQHGAELEIERRNARELIERFQLAGVCLACRMRAR